MKKTPDVVDKDSTNFAWLLASAQASCVTPFTRKNAGINALGLPMGLAAVLLWFWIMCTQCSELFYVAGAWLIMVVLRRSDAARERRNGIIEHSWYVGYPFWTAWLIKNERWARAAEGMIIGFTGYFLMTQGLPGLGKFMIASGGAILMIESMMMQQTEKQKIVIQDSEIEMRQLMREMGRG